MSFRWSTDRLKRYSLPFPIIAFTYLGCQLWARKLLALESLEESTLEPAYAELQMLQLVGKENHPNIIHLHDFGITKDVLYIVMELAEGDLANLLKSNDYQPFPRRVLLEILLQIARGLRYLHDLRVCHRDMKPQNGIGSPLLHVSNFPLQCYSCPAMILFSKSPISVYPAVMQDRPIPRLWVAPVNAIGPRRSLMSNGVYKRISGAWAASCCI